MLRPRRIPTYALILGLLTLGVISPAHAQKDPRADAKAHYSNGKKLYEQGQYEQAIEEFRTADQLAPSGVNDFNIALCYESLDKPADAVRFYRSYLVRMPDAANRAGVEQSIARLEKEAEAAAQREADNARQAAADAEARRIEEEQRAKRQPPPPGGGQGVQPTGDPELDRVAAINVGQVRDERRVQPAGGAMVGPPPPQGGAGAPAPAPAPAPEPKKSKPVYKQWWFWVVVGVSAYVLIAIVADSSDSTSQPRQMRMLDMPTPAPAGNGGFTVLHF